MNELYLRLHIVEVIHETADAFTYRLEDSTGKPLNYQAGQFLTLLITLHGTEYRRSYSFSTTPGVDPLPAITIREKENGEISRYILRNWKAGDIVTAIQPSGRFTLGTTIDRPRDIFLFGAGSGITPLFSLLKQILYYEPETHVKLVYSNTSQERTIFHRQLQTLEAQFGERLHIMYFFSNENISPYRRLSNILLEPLVKEQMRFNKTDAQFFVCGPPDYMRMIILTLTFMGFAEDQLHKENFVVNTSPQLARMGTPEDKTVKEVLLKTNKGEYQLLVPGNMTILNAALAKGIPLPYSCRGGVCGSCTAHCSEGKVWMAWNEVLTDKEIAQGLVLTCTSYPVSASLRIEI
ncbi:ring-1,2-phenylacetyl-CoA epoxidase subunit PaaE [Chitinophaga sp. CF118]|uniref:ferredoxin--NADP reductase n=1 Tax=Chitinophaga sp. CF118 TaxID=1884367 RepID=UPI0008E19F3D|nr:ferredoxin--NADP reductase [Chitinophaga sp. CF118]SFD27777.1 ring-1,2-phenylacetyl-CoA epoxidase subunit PaaE [Chitinophaga sp. CF118]